MAILYFDSKWQDNGNGDKMAGFDHHREDVNGSMITQSTLTSNTLQLYQNSCAKRLNGCKHDVDTS